MSEVTRVPVSELTLSNGNIGEIKDATAREAIENIPTASPASSDHMGLIQLGYEQNQRNYPVEIDEEHRAYVNVPWENTHQDISTKLDSSLKGVANGLAELDANGKVPSSQLPSYVDDILEYADTSSFPVIGESGKIYVALNNNKTYRWSGSEYTEVSASLALGETDSTAYRGDRGAAAYAHAVTNKGSAYSSGLYKITTNAEGHVIAATAVEKADITALGIPGSDTNTTYSAGSNITLNGTTFSLTKANVTGALGYTPLQTHQTITKAIVTAALGYTPPSSDTNTTYSAGSNITLNGTTFSLTKANVTGALGYTPLQSHQTITKAIVTAALGYTPPTTNTTYSAGSNITLSGTQFSLTKANVTAALGLSPISGITKAMVTAALGYTPPSSDTNTTYSAGSNITLSGTKFSLTKANVTGALGYTPPTSDTNTWRGIVNNLTSTSTTDSLSAAQGKVLKDKIVTVTLYNGNPAKGTTITLSESGENFLALVFNAMGDNYHWTNTFLYNTYSNGSLLTVYSPIYQSAYMIILKRVSATQLSVDNKGGSCSGLQIYGLVRK